MYILKVMYAEPYVEVSTKHIYVFLFNTPPSKQANYSFVTSDLMYTLYFKFRPTKTEVGR